MITINQQFGRLTVLEKAPKEKGKNAKWHCRCACGNLSTVRSDRLKSGKTQSCGCLQKERLSKAKTTHGHARKNKKTKEWLAWKSMKQRCYYEKDKGYPTQGALGIVMCEEWRNSFAQFLEDMGEAPEGTALRRYSNYDNYTMKNCHWRPCKKRPE